MPSGVAAFESPSMFAATFMIIAPMAGCSGGISGKRSRLIGRSALPRSVIKPAASATRMMPSQSVMIPTRPREISTAVFAESMALFVTTAAVPLKIATMNAIAINANQM